LHLWGGFRGWAIKRRQLHFPPTNPRCHGNEIWDKIGYNSACVGDFCVIFAPIGSFRGWAIERRQFAFPPTDPRCHGNEIWDKMGYNLTCVRDFCAYREVFGDGPLHAANHIFAHRPPFPWQRNLGQKLAITR